MKSEATTVKQYLAELPPDRRSAIEAVRHEILRSIDHDVEEGMQCGMIGFYIPHRAYPAGYRCNPKEPLPYAGLASQKNHMSVYLSCVYSSTAEEAWFRGAWARTGKKLDMGRSCIRFKTLEGLALEVIGEAIRRVPAKRFIELYESVLADSRKRSAARSGKKAGKPAKKSPADKPGKPGKQTRG